MVLSQEEEGRALACAGIPVTIWRFSLGPGKEVILKGVRSDMVGGKVQDHCVSSGSGSAAGGGVDVISIVSVTVVGGASTVIVTVSVGSGD